MNNRHQGIARIFEGNWGAHYGWKRMVGAPAGLGSCLGGVSRITGRVPADPKFVKVYEQLSEMLQCADCPEWQTRMARTRMALTALWLLVFVALRTSLCLAAIPVQHGHLSVTPVMTLKDLFDGGLQPFRLGDAPGGLLSECMVLETELEVTFPTGGRVQMPLKMGTFKILADDSVSRVELNGAYMNVDEAALKAKEICTALKMSTDGLNQTVSQLTRANASQSRWGQR